MIESKEKSMTAVIERVALDPSCDVDKMEKIISMQERIFDKNAEIEYNKAMCECQKSMPTVARDRENTHTKSSYAAFESILNTVRPTYTSHGFGLSFGTEVSPMDSHIRITCKIMHSGGHSKMEVVDLPLDMMGIGGKKNKTEVHATASTYSYGKRYLMTMIFNIAIASHDDDAVAAGGVTIQDLLTYNAVVADNIGQICDVKAAIANEDPILAMQVWRDFSEMEAQILWRAPSKGGIITTAERAYMKSDACSSSNRNKTKQDGEA